MTNSTDIRNTVTYYLCDCGWRIIVVSAAEFPRKFPLVKTLKISLLCVMHSHKNIGHKPHKMYLKYFLKASDMLINNIVNQLRRRTTFVNKNKSNKCIIY